MKVLVDDQTWMIGANAKIIVAKESSNIDLYPWFYSHQGTYVVLINARHTHVANRYQVLRQTIYSPQLKNNRPLVIYTPPSYYENTLKVRELFFSFAIRISNNAT